ncbi:hypothetical protein HWV62_39754 [Athelia sp. TMB]|nr:hypothetical protein HWV62_39754 [Athelia sp. TMB]
MASIEQGTDSANYRTVQNGTRSNGQNQPLWDPSRSYATRHPSRIANPGALGLFSFASTTLVLSFITVSTHGVHTPNIVVGMALFTGGLVQLLAGMWEFPRGNVFGATFFASYGAFWLSYATIFIPSNNIIGAYATLIEFNHALGIYFISWFIFTFLLFIGALRKNMAFISLLSFWWLTFLLLAIGRFNGSRGCTITGGAFGIITAFIAYYCALSALLVFEESYFMLPLGDAPKHYA